VDPIEAEIKVKAKGRRQMADGKREDSKLEYHSLVGWAVDAPKNTEQYKAPRNGTFLLLTFLGVYQEK